nr:MAG TPA: hypothetical protein [Caudoviricetes sp.]
MREKYLFIQLNTYLFKSKSRKVVKTFMRGISSF